MFLSFGKNIRFLSAIQDTDENQSNTGKQLIVYNEQDSISTELLQGKPICMLTEALWFVDPRFLISTQVEARSLSERSGIIRHHRLCPRSTNTLSKQTFSLTVLVVLLNEPAIQSKIVVFSISFPPQKVQTKKAVTLDKSRIPTFPIK